MLLQNPGSITRIDASRRWKDVADRTTRLLITAQMPAGEKRYVFFRFFLMLFYLTRHISLRNG
jgi:hypothetical protein